MGISIGQLVKGDFHRMAAISKRFFSEKIARILVAAIEKSK